MYLGKENNGPVAENFVSMKEDLVNSDAHMGLRLSCGGSYTHCATCGQLRTEPYRRWLDGAVVEGCIDASHTNEMFAQFGRKDSSAASSNWHFRGIARAWRAECLQNLRRIAKGR